MRASTVSFVVERWAQVFGFLRWLSPFQIVRLCIPKTRRSHRFVDSWVFGHLLLSLVLLVAVRAPNLHWWEIIFLIYGGVRVFEVVIYQINVLLFDEYRKRKSGESYAVRGYRRIVILLLNNYAEIIFWFALFYRNLTWAFETRGVMLNSFFASLNLSFATMTKFGFVDISPKQGLGEVLIFVQSAIGLFMAVLVIARFIALIPRPETMDELEKK